MQVVVWIRDKDLIHEPGMSVNNDGKTPTTLFQQTYKQGDVIDCLPDGAELGTETMKHPHWAVLSVPDLLPSTADALKQTGRPDPDLVELDVIYPARKRNLDINKLGLMKKITASEKPMIHSFTAQEIADSVIEKME